MAESKMIVGICDDEQNARIEVRELCDKYFSQNKESSKFVEFVSGEEVLDYCSKIENEPIDLLFLDIEMKDLDGVRLMEQLVKNRTVRRIVFVTSHKDKVFDAFGQKTIGFILKPPSYERVEKMLSVVRKEKQDNTEFILKDYQGGECFVLSEEIVYLKAAGSYTEIYTLGSDTDGLKCQIVSKRIGELERELAQFPIMRVHKSYLVCLTNVVCVEDEVRVRNTDFGIPIGRKYKDKVKKAYLQYVSDKVRMRL